MLLMSAHAPAKVRPVLPPPLPRHARRSKHLVTVTAILLAIAMLPVFDGVKHLVEKGAGPDLRTATAVPLTSLEMNLTEFASSNAPPGQESARVVLVGLYDFADAQPGSAFVTFRGTAYVFVDTYARETNFDLNEVRGDIVFRFLRFGP